MTSKIFSQVFERARERGASGRTTVLLACTSKLMVTRPLQYVDRIALSITA